MLQEHSGVLFNFKNVAIDDLLVGYIKQNFFEQNG